MFLFKANKSISMIRRDIELIVGAVVGVALSMRLKCIRGDEIGQ